MRDAMKFIKLLVRCDIKSRVDVGVQRLIAKSRFAKRGDVDVPTSCFEVKASKCCDGAAERMSDEHKLVGWVSRKGFGNVRHDDFASVKPRGVEAGVDSAICAFR